MLFRFEFRCRFILKQLNSTMSFINILWHLIYCVSYLKLIILLSINNGSSKLKIITVNLILQSSKLAPMNTSNNNRNQSNQLPNQQNNTKQQQGEAQKNNQNPQNAQNAELSKKKKRQITLKPQHFQNPTKGLKKLYELTNQIKWEDPMTTQSAMNLVVVALKSWQTQLLPKYYYEYFFQRCQALGSDKQVSAYMNKVRRIHKGLDIWDQNKYENNDPNKQNTQKDGKKGNAESDGEGLDIGNNDFAAPLGGYQDYEDDANELQKFKQKANIAKKLGENFHSTNKKSQIVQNNKTSQQQIDELMDEDLRMFQEMNRRKNEQTNKNNKNGRQAQESDEGMDLGGESGIVLDDDYYDD